MKLATADQLVESLGQESVAIFVARKESIILVRPPKAEYSATYMSVSDARKARAHLCLPDLAKSYALEFVGEAHFRIESPGLALQEVSVKFSFAIPTKTSVSSDMILHV